MDVVVSFNKAMVKRILCLASLLVPIAQACGQTPDCQVANNSNSDQLEGDANNMATLRDVLPSGAWKRVDAAVMRALTWAASQQQDDGSFPTLESGQAAVTSLCAMAFVSQGHARDDGQSAKLIDSDVRPGRRLDSPKRLRRMRLSRSHN
jgi:hypothetical protein